MNNDSRKKLIKVTIITLVMLGFMIAGGSNYMYNNGLSGKYINTQAKDGQIKVACVGDSVTYGHGVEDWTKNSYPVVLQQLLGDGYHVSNFGSSGACVNPEGDQPYINRDIYKEALAYNADIIVVMIGSNDSKPENWTDVESFLEDYVALLTSFTQGERVPKVYVALSPKVFYTEDADKSTGIASYDIQPAKVDEIVAAVKENAANSELIEGIIDVHSLTEAHAEWFENDGVHPNKDGAKAIAEAIATVIQSQE